jgi:trans-aconitate methyltransferase
MIYGKSEHLEHRLRTASACWMSVAATALWLALARARPRSQVTGVDYDPRRLAEAQVEDHPALSSVEADATQSVPRGPWDIIMLSNVLEHIVDRHAFLTALIDKTKAKRFLIRVPLFERDWRLSMRREVGANYYSDPDREIEPTQEEFRREAAAAGLVVEQLNTPWGESWSVLGVGYARP